MRNPYDVLGVSSNATDEEIKKAYRSLSRKYHPDANVNNPNKAQAEEKFKEVQQAYDSIMKSRQGGGYDYGFGSQAYGGRSTGGYGSQGAGNNYYDGDNQNTYGGFSGFEDFFGGFGGFYNFGNMGGMRGMQARADDSNEIKAAINYCNTGHYMEALNVLNSVSDRNSRWYFVSARVNAAMGNNVTAKEHIGKAVQMEPSNMEYRRFKEQLDYGGNWYQDMGQTYTRDFTNVSPCCTGICLSQLLCSMFGGCCF